MTAESPASGATGVAVSSTETATFSEAVQPGTINFALKNSSGSSVPATVSYNSAKHAATLTPSATLAYNTSYTATVSGAENSNGTAMAAPFTWSFKTDGPPPSVKSETPASSATNVAISTTATATFNEAVQASTIGFTLTPKGGSPVSATLTYNSSNYTATLTPSAALAYNTTYTATVSGAKDTAGDPMSGPFSWSFTTDPAAPKVTSETPASSATNVAVSTTATATFNEAVQSSTISFTLTPSGGSPVGATLTYNSSNYTATLTPSAALAYNTKYTATVSGAKDNAGDPMSSPFSWSFTTDPAAPKVTSETPASAATNVAISTTATATFNEAVQASTISFTLTPKGGSPVAATVTYNSSNYTATLTPSAALAYNTTYTATVSGAKDTAGDPMAAPFSWSFTTAAASSTATATFIEQDTTTQGSWIGTYGSQGYDVIGNATSLPSYATYHACRRVKLYLGRKHDRPAVPSECRRLRPYRRLLVLVQQLHRRRGFDRWPDARLGVVLRRLGYHHSCRASTDQQRLNGSGAEYRECDVVQLGRLPQLGRQREPVDHNHQHRPAQRPSSADCSLTRLDDAPA